MESRVFEEVVEGKVEKRVDKTADEPIRFQTHESGILYYVIPLINEKTQEKLELKIFQSLSNKRLEFETYNEYVVRRKFIKNEEKKKKKTKALIWDSSKWGTMSQENAMRLLENLRNDSKLSDKQREKLNNNLKIKQNGD